MHYASDLAYFTVMELDESRPVIKNFTGDWCVDASRSDDLGPLWTAMSVGWLTRRLVSAVKIDTHIYHTREAFIATDNSILGSFTINLVPDGKWRCVTCKVFATACFFNK